MKIRILTFVLLLLSNLIFSQNVEVIRKSDKYFFAQSNDFTFLEEKTDVSQLDFVATFKATEGNNSATIEKLFYAISEKAKNAGANSYKLISYERNDSTTMTSLVLETYFATDTMLNENLANHEKNLIFVFSDEGCSGNENYTLKVDNKKITIRSGSYFKKSIKPNMNVKINKGGILGTTTWIKWKSDRQPVFLTLTGLGMDFGANGVYFNTGSINKMDSNFGHLLVKLLRESEQ